MTAARLRTTAGGLVLALALVGCTSGPEEAASPTPSATVTSGVEGGLVLVDPRVITGITSEVEEDLSAGSYAYLTLPVVPGAEGLLPALRERLQAEISRFRELVTPAAQQPYPELIVSWDLVGASPEIIGIRLVSGELGEDQTFAGKVETAWWAPDSGEFRPVSDFITEDAEAEFFARLQVAAAADPEVDPDAFVAQLEGEWDAFDSVGFAPNGDLWVEFDAGQVGTGADPIGVEVSTDGLLSEVGTIAQAAALNPQDPALRAASSSPAASPTMSPTAASPRPSPAGSSSTAVGATASAAPSAAGTGPTVDCSTVKCAALTFDDGPVAGTNDLLDVLKEKQVKATFFMVGSNVKVHPEIVQRMVAEGHVVGNHTLDHPQLTRLSAAAIRKEIDTTNRLIESAGGVRPTLLRPPYGATNSQVAAVAAELGMAQILWNVDPEDWKDRNSAVVTRRVLASTRNGSIVLSHDIHATTRAAYAGIIDGLRAKGFTLVTVPELLGGSPQPGRKYSAR